MSTKKASTQPAPCGACVIDTLRRQVVTGCKPIIDLLQTEARERATDKATWEGLRKLSCRYRAETIAFAAVLADVRREIVSSHDGKAATELAGIVRRHDRDRDAETVS